jgi:SAM-dependent methyltransferase
VKSVFDGYSRYYDLLYRDKDYAAEAAYVLSCIHSHAPGARRLLELGCGTAAHAVALARQGMRVHGIDSSESMLGRAKLRIDQVPKTIASRIRIEPGDVRVIRTEEKYDAVISLFHVVSYLNSDQDLRRAFETAFQHLEPGGLFLFDFWYGPAVLTQGPEVKVRRLSDPDCEVTRIAEPVVRSLENIVDVNYTLFIHENGSGAITQLRERHSMRYLFLPEIRALASDWFELVDARAWLCDRSPDTTTWSSFVTMVRKP